MTIYDDIKKSIYQSLFYYGQPGRMLHIEKCFIYEDRQVIVAIISDSPYLLSQENQNNVSDYYYGIYDVLSQSAIQQYSNEYQNIVDFLPKPNKINLIDIDYFTLKNFEKQEVNFIEQFSLSDEINKDYWKLLECLSEYIADYKTLNIFNFFIGNHKTKRLEIRKKEVKVEEVTNKNVKINDLSENKNENSNYDNNIIKTSTNDVLLNSNLSDTYYQNNGNTIEQVVFQNSMAVNTSVNNEKKEEEKNTMNVNDNAMCSKEETSYINKSSNDKHTIQIIIVTLISIILGTISATLVAGPWH
jgi:hypothetical protein